MTIGDEIKNIGKDGRKSDSSDKRNRSINSVKRQLLLDNRITPPSLWPERPERRYAIILRSVTMRNNAKKKKKGRIKKIYNGIVTEVNDNRDKFDRLTRLLLLLLNPFKACPIQIYDLICNKRITMEMVHRIWPSFIVFTGIYKSFDRASYCYCYYYFRGLRLTNNAGIKRISLIPPPPPPPPHELRF